MRYFSEHYGQFRFRKNNIERENGSSFRKKFDQNGVVFYDLFFLFVNIFFVSAGNLALTLMILDT